MSIERERDEIMRRFWVIVVGAALLIPAAAPAVSAQPERYPSRSYNAFWHTKRKIDAHSYRRVTWYAGVYEGSESFWSDLYRYVERCERRPGRDRCRSGPYMVGEIDDLGSGSFSLEKGLDSGSFVATYPMEIYDRGDERAVGKIRIAVDLVGTGGLTTSREEYSSKDGCEHMRYSGRWQYRQAVASGALTFLRTGKTLRLRDTEEANMSQGETMSITHEC